MAEARATLKYLRISPRKVSIICDQIRGKSVAEAKNILAFIPKAGADPLLQVLNSAAANADPGPIIKRFMPRAKGRAYSIKKRTCHLVVVVKEREAE